MVKKDPRVYKDNFEVGRYSLTLESKESHWEGDSGKMEDMPGDFFSAKLFLRGIQDPDALEKLASEKSVDEIFPRDSFRKEITNEPEGYAELLHKHHIKEFSSKPESYYKRLVQAVLKKKL